MRVLPPLLLAVLLSACGSSTTTAPEPTTSAAPPTSAAVTPTGTPVRFGNPTSVITDLDAPWGVTFLPNGNALIAERDDADIRVVANGATIATAKVDGVVPGGEGGLLGLAASPTYATDQWIYAYFTAANDNRVVRFHLNGDTISDQDVVLSGLDKASTHNGGRLAFGPDGFLYVTVGDAGSRESAQDRASLNGKILRMTADGQPAPGNPFDSLVYSMGHRNPQGLAWDASGALYAVEFGQNRFDEVNLITAGGNYGWPTVEGRGDTQGGTFTNPLVTWTTSEASPSGAAIVNEGDTETLYVAGLGGERLWRVPLDGRGGVGEATSSLNDRGRLRTVVNAPDGSLWVSTSNTDGRGSGEPDSVLRLTPQPA